MSLKKKQTSLGIIALVCSIACVILGWLYGAGYRFCVVNDELIACGKHGCHHSWIATPCLRLPGDRGYIPVFFGWEVPEDKQGRPKS